MYTPYGCIASGSKMPYTSSLCDCCGEIRIKRISKSNDINRCYGRPYYRCDGCGTFDWAPMTNNDNRTIALIGKKARLQQQRRTSAVGRRAVSSSNRNRKKKRVFIESDHDEQDFGTNSVIGRRQHHGPICQCGQMSIQRVVKNPECPYVGQRFWCCSFYPKGCRFFEFCCSSSSPSTSSSVIVTPVDDADNSKQDQNVITSRRDSDCSFTSVDPDGTKVDDQDQSHIVTPDHSYINKTSAKRRKMVHFDENIQVLPIKARMRKKK